MVDIPATMEVQLDMDKKQIYIRNHESGQLELTDIPVHDCPIRNCPGHLVFTKERFQTNQGDVMWEFECSASWRHVFASIQNGPLIKRYVGR